MHGWFDESFNLTEHQKARPAKGETADDISVFLVIDDMSDHLCILHPQSK